MPIETDPLQTDRLQGDHTGHPTTLPLPELNPLSNPLLSGNMGRWAEVYFRNPPENRERAVVELLQQLQAENSGSGRTEVSEPPAPERSVPAPQFRLDPVETQLKNIRCDSCGHENPEDQKFCGMCGAPTGNDAAALNPAMREATRVAEYAPRAESENEPRVARNEFLHLQDRPQQDRPQYDRPPYDRPHYLDEDRNRDQRTIQFFGYEERPRSYRGYAAMLVLVLMLGLGYVGWRKARATVPTQAPSVTQQVATSSPSSTPATEAANPEPAEKSYQPPREEAGKTGDGKTGDNKRMSPAALVGKEPAAPAPQPPAAADGGSEELATAQSYLSGTSGHERNEAQARDWLWRAVAKRNAAATLLLADLYLHGNGVQKNCDQARVLLDAAASRGVRDAGVRLRNMPAFGCE